jgi:Zn-dependent protease with chaperone function
MTENDASKRRRLNPFAFPSETNVRFTLLVVAALMLTINLAQLIGWSTGIVHLPDVLEDDVDLLTPASVGQLEESMNETIVQTARALALLGVFLLSTLTLAAVIYRGHPSRIRRKYKLRLMAGSDGVQFLDGIKNLVNVSGLSHAPSVEIATRSRTVDGQAFGVRGQYALRLGGRIPLLLRKNPGSFRAIVLHELAHIANGDVARAYFSQAIWIAVVIVTVIPTIAFIVFIFAQSFTGKLTDGLSSVELVRLFTLNLPTVLIVLFQFGGTLAIIAAIRSSLLRIREVYADWRAALWGAEAPLADILRHNMSEDKTPLWARLLRLHPVSQERLATLQNPQLLFRITTELPFFVGVLLAYVGTGATILGLNLGQILVPGFISGILQLWQNFSHPLISIVSALIFLATIIALLVIGSVVGFGVAYLIAGALGLAVQRDAVADMGTGRQGWAAYMRLWKPAALVSIGFQIGILLMPFSYLASLPEFASDPRGLTVLSRVILSVVATACLTWLWLVYIRFFAQRTLGLHASTFSPHMTRRILTLASSGLLLVLYLQAMIAQIVILDASTDNTTIPIQIWAASLFITVLIYLVIVGATWLLVQVYRLFHKSHCPACGQVTRQPYAVGKTCEHCGLDLAPWLFVAQP